MIKLALELQEFQLFVRQFVLMQKKGYFMERNSMEQNPFGEVNGSSVTQEILCILQNLKVHCCIQKSPRLVPNLSQINPVPAVPISLRSILIFSHLCLRLPNGNLWPLSTEALAYTGSHIQSSNFMSVFCCLCPSKRTE